MTRRAVGGCVLAFSALAVLLAVVVWQSSVHLDPKDGKPPVRQHLEHGDEVIGPWLGWDASFYALIQRDGYPTSDRAAFDQRRESRVAFFPGYPMAARAVGNAVGDAALGLWLVTLLSGAVALVLMYRWSSERLGGDVAVCATAALFLFPWAYVLVGAGYSDALFVALALGAFLLVEHDRPVLAGLVGAAAALTRAAGIGVVIGLALRVAERRGVFSTEGRRVDLARLHPRDLGVGLAAVGLGGWMAFGWARYGDPLAFSTAQRGWSQGLGRRSLLKLGLWDQIQHNSDRGFVVLLIVQAIVIIAACVQVPRVWRRLGPAYATYCVVALGLPLLGSANFISNGRFVIAAFPVFGVVGERLAALPPPRAQVILTASAVVLLVFASYWGRGYLMG